MAQTLSFYKGSSFTTYKAGAIYFDETNHIVKVGKGGEAFDVFSGVRSASWNETGKILTIVNELGNSFNINLSDVASAQAVSEELGKIWTVIGSEAKGSTPASGLIGDVREAEADIDALETKAATLESSIDAVDDRVDAVVTAQTNFETSVAATYAKIDEIPVYGIAAGEKIISVSGTDTGYAVSTTLGISYDSENKKIKLVGKSGVQIGEAVDCAPFIADGILDRVELVELSNGQVSGKEAGKYFKFTWNGDSGKDPMYIPMADFAVKTYTAGKDLNVSGSGEFDIALDQDIEISGVKVGNLGVDVTRLTAGMSLSEILTAMLCKDIDVKVNAYPSVSSIYNQVPAHEYEVGSTVPGFTLSTSFNDGSFASSDTALYPVAKFKDSEHNGASPLAAGCTSNGFTWTGISGTSTGNTANVDSFKIGASGKTFSVKASYTASTVVPKTLLKNNSSVKISAGTTDTVSVTISAYYKDFYGVIPASNTNVTADSGLTSVDGITLGNGHKHSTSSFTINVSPGDKGVYIWTKNTIKSFMNGSDNFTADLKKTTVNYVHNEVSTQYNLYSFPNVAGYAKATEYVVTLN